MRSQASTTLLPVMVDAPSLQESELRADSFHSLVYHQCREQLEIIIDDMDGDIFCETVQLHRPRKVGIKFERALKWLTCISIQLTGIENGGAGCPQWLVVFLFRALLYADAKCESPDAKTVIEQFGSLNAGAMLTLVSEAALVEIEIENQSMTRALAARLVGLHEERQAILKSALLSDHINLSRQISTNFLARLASVTVDFC
jgi:hypothetical protein